MVNPYFFPMEFEDGLELILAITARKIKMFSFQSKHENVTYLAPEKGKIISVSFVNSNGYLKTKEQNRNVVANQERGYVFYNSWDDFASSKDFEQFRGAYRERN